MGKAEVWKPVIGYKGLYEASDAGRVRSLPRQTTKGKILKQHVNPRNGYCYVSLSDGKNHHTTRVHKIVYEAFSGDVCNGYDKTKTINHIDGHKTNNSMDNLERISQSQNQVHAFENGLQKREGIEVICLDTKVVYKSATEAAKSAGGRIGEMVSRVCRGERSHYRNRHFAFLKDYENGTIPVFSGRKRKASESLWR